MTPPRALLRCVYCGDPTCSCRDTIGSPEALPEADPDGGAGARPPREKKKVVPVTVAKVELSNSALNCVHTKHRSTMVQRRLNALLLLFIHKERPLDMEAVINRFAAQHAQRLLLQSPLAQVDSESEASDDDSS